MAEALATYLQSLQKPTTHAFVTAFFARRLTPTRTTLEGNQAISNQIRLHYRQHLPDTPDPHPVIIPMVRRVISSPVHP